MKSVDVWKLNNVAGLHCSYGTIIRRVAVQRLVFSPRMVVVQIQRNKPLEMPNNFTKTLSPTPLWFAPAGFISIWCRSGSGPGCVKTLQALDSRSPDQMQHVGRLTGFGVDNIPSGDNGP